MPRAASFLGLFLRGSRPVHGESIVGSRSARSSRWTPLYRLAPREKILCCPQCLEMDIVCVTVWYCTRMITIDSIWFILQTVCTLHPSDACISQHFWFNCGLVPGILLSTGGLCPKDLWRWRPLRRGPNEAHESDCTCIWLYGRSLTRANFFKFHQISRVWEL